MHFMKQFANNAVLQFKNSLLNSKLQRYVETQAQNLLREPENTLGVLIRGTDYVRSRPSGHPVQADVEIVIKKIYELEKSWRSYSYIFLSTEDADILKRMQQEFKERLFYTDQKRYHLEEGQLLCHQKASQAEGEGYTKGAEYLCTLSLLSKCDAFVASGGCAGTHEVLKMNQGSFKRQYIFDLGVYP